MRRAARNRAQNFPISRHMGSSCARVGWQLEAAHAISPSPTIWDEDVRGIAGRRGARTVLPSSRHLGRGCARQAQQRQPAHAISPIPAIWDEGVRTTRGLMRPRTLFPRFPPYGLWLRARRMAVGSRARYLPVSHHLGDRRARVSPPPYPAHTICPFPAIWAEDVRGL
jgi:hypothetical protein